MTPASTSDARKRNAEKSTRQAYALARSSRDCQRGQHDDCNGLAYDPAFHRVIRCMCGCRIANDTDVTIPPLDTPDASTGHGDGLEANLEEGKGDE